MVTVHVVGASVALAFALLPRAWSFIGHSLFQCPRAPQILQLLFKIRSCKDFRFPDPEKEAFPFPEDLKPNTLPLL